jgi:cytochrome c-type biogenesis protein
LLTLVGLLILTGGDHLIEGLLVMISPDWLNDLTSSV